jgi:hypothetical protein
VRGRRGRHHLHVDELRTRAGSLFLTLRAEVADTTGAPVLTATR